MKTDPRMVKTRDAAKIIGVSKRTILNMMHDGRLKGRQAGYSPNSDFLISCKSIREYLGEADT